MELPLACAQYITSRNGSVGYMEDPSYTCDLSMIFDVKKKDLYQRTNETIAMMQEDGSMDALKTQYIDSVVATDEEPEPVEIPQTSGLETMHIFAVLQREVS